jgi:hypothetical protein
LCLKIADLNGEGEGRQRKRGLKEKKREIVGERKKLRGEKEGKERK